VAFILSTGCTRNFDDINTDSNKVKADRYAAEFDLTRAQLEFTGNSDFSFDTWRVNIIYCGMMIQHLANASWYVGDKYQRNDSWSAAYFEVAYRDQVKYIVDMLNLTRDKPELFNLYHVARIMKVLIFHRITDLYGDVPYKEAGLGYYNNLFTPLYDRQEDIYLDMLQELEDAAAKLDPVRQRPGTGDLIYRGAPDNIIKWKRLAHALMLRLAMRMVKKNAALAKVWSEKAYTGGVFTSNDDNAYVVHDLAGGRNTVNRNSNILGGEWNATGWDRGSNSKKEVFLSETFIDFFKTNFDPRLRYLALVRANGNTSPGQQQGLPNGYDQNRGATDISAAPGYPGDIDKYSTIRGDVMLKLNGPTELVTYAQCEFLLAEAAQRGWNVGASASTHYANGVTAAMTQFQQYDPGAVIPEGAITSYLAAHPYDAVIGLEQINTQYWAASFLDWYETWANWRRSGYPELKPVNYPGNATNGQIPRRMLYPSSEAANNSNNYQAALNRQGANDFMTRVWWDVP
jgi:hypothetical protein